jgi:hypothetical protein
MGFMMKEGGSMNEVRVSRVLPFAPSTSVARRWVTQTEDWTDEQFEEFVQFRRIDRMFDYACKATFHAMKRGRRYISFGRRSDKPEGIGLFATKAERTFCSYRLSGMTFWSWAQEVCYRLADTGFWNVKKDTLDRFFDQLETGLTEKRLSED